MRKSTARTTVTLRELPEPTAGPELTERDQVVFVTNAVRRRGGLRSRAEHRPGEHRPVLAAVVR
jgi:hypothetical protein